MTQIKVNTLSKEELDELTAELLDEYTTRGYTFEPMFENLNPSTVTELREALDEY